jgi:hypothetical protein
MTPSPNPSPKQKFLGIKHCVDAHRDLMQRPDLLMSLEQTLLQLQWDLCGGNIQGNVDGNGAAARYYKLLGAHEFLRIFKTLAEVPMVLPTPTTGEIDHNSFK